MSRYEGSRRDGEPSFPEPVALFEEYFRNIDSANVFFYPYTETQTYALGLGNPRTKKEDYIRHHNLLDAAEIAEESSSYGDFFRKAEEILENGVGTEDINCFNNGEIHLIYSRENFEEWIRSDETMDIEDAI